MAGLGVLGYEPRVFWSMTPREFVYAMRARSGVDPLLEPLRRRELATLMESFPDR